MKIGDLVLYTGKKEDFPKYGIIVSTRLVVPSYNYVIKNSRKDRLYKICFPHFTGWFKLKHFVAVTEES